MRENFPRLPILTPPALRRKADAIRKDVVDVCVRNGAGHIAPSLSCVDILTVLYYRVLRISRDPRWEGRDRLIFSKAHGGYALYSILTDLGYIDRKDWESFYRGSFLSGCVSRSEGHGLEAGCGALGHGLPIAVGIAWGAKLRRKGITVYCVVGDGEAGVVGEDDRLGGCQMVFNFGQAVNVSLTGHKNSSSKASGNRYSCWGLNDRPRSLD